MSEEETPTNITSCAEDAAKNSPASMDKASKTPTPAAANDSPNTSSTSKTVLTWPDTPELHITCLVLFDGLIDFKNPIVPHDQLRGYRKKFDTIYKAVKPDKSYKFMGPIFETLTSLREQVEVNKLLWELAPEKRAQLSEGVPATSLEMDLGIIDYELRKMEEKLREKYLEGDSVVARLASVVSWITS